MGWERKRGKLTELNALLRGAGDTSFLPCDVPQGVRFVVTLDADTRLPRDALRRMVGKMAHPLNAPVADARGRVIRGYGILQPHVTPLMPNRGAGSAYQRITAAAGGMQPYAAARSDIWQDLFAEGSFTGKGIYEVDTFSAALAGRVPENSLLSHDLFEGAFARAGLATDIQVIEEFPTRPDVDARRQHRWTRGDWQMLPWILGAARARHHGAEPVEDDRQPAPVADGAGDAGRAGLGLWPAAGRRGGAGPYGGCPMSSACPWPSCRGVPG